MEVLDIYRSSKNPLDEEQTKRLLDMLLTSDKPYGKLIRLNRFNKETKIPAGRLSKFECYMFNLWKKSIVETSEERINSFDEKTKEGYKLLIEEFKNTPDVKDIREIQNIAKKMLKNELTEYAYTKYYYRRVDFDESWQHTLSDSLHAYNTEMLQNIKHRLYINADLSITHDLLTEFMEKCEQDKIPFYFKYTNKTVRDDGIVVYSNDKYLSKYIDILNEIKNNHPEYNEHLGTPTILSTQINDWIGYGSEPLQKRGQKPKSFNEKRIDILKDCLSSTTKKWISQNKDMMIDNEGNNIPYKEYLSMKMTEEAIKFIKDNMTEELNPEILEIIETDVFKEAVLYSYQKHIDNIIDETEKNNSFDDIYNIKFSKSGKITEIPNKEIIESVYQQQAQEIHQRFDSYQALYREEVLSACSEQDIDPNNFAFDLHITSRFKEIINMDEMFKDEQTQENTHIK